MNGSSPNQRDHDLAEAEAMVESKTGRVPIFRDDPLPDYDDPPSSDDDQTTRYSSSRSRTTRLGQRPPTLDADLVRRRFFLTPIRDNEYNPAV